MKFFVHYSLLVALPLLSQALVIPHDAASLSIFGGEVDTKVEEGLKDISKLTAASEKLQHANEHAKEDRFAPLIVSDSASDKVVDDSYIIVFNDDVDEQVAHEHRLMVESLHLDTMSVMKKRGLQHPLFGEGIESGLKHIFNIGQTDGGFKGYSGSFHPDVVEFIRRHPAVKFVERDSIVSINEFETQTDAPWGLARVSHRDPLSLGSFNKYLYDSDGGEGVTAYVIDTGVNIEHIDLEGRAKWGKTIPEGDTDVDGNGHGSHCSGTIGGGKYGVAKNVNIVAVKVLRTDGTGSMSDVLKGVEYAAEAHLAEKKKNKKHKGSTANMSLGGGKSPSLDIAVNAAVKSGLHFAVAAGNDNADACRSSPAAADLPITVGASSLSDERAYFSNYGKCVDIFAPGVNVQSIYTGSKYAIATLSGTSMASPHICGLLSYFVSLQPTSDSEFAVYGSLTPKQLKKALISYGTKGILSDVDEDTPNILAYNGAGKNISDFWTLSREDSLVEKQQESGSGHESTLRILPVDLRTEIKDVVAEIVEDLEEVFEDVGAIYNHHME